MGYASPVAGHPPRRDDAGRVRKRDGAASWHGCPGTAVRGAARFPESGSSAVGQPGRCGPGLPGCGGTPLPGARPWTGQNGSELHAAACGAAGEQIPAGAEAPGVAPGPFFLQARAAAASCGRPDVRDNVDVDIPDRLAWHGGQEAMTDGHG
jgi:hypothetical protein